MSFTVRFQGNIAAGVCLFLLALCCSSTSLARGISTDLNHFDIFVEIDESTSFGGESIISEGAHLAGTEDFRGDIRVISGGVLYTGSPSSIGDLYIDGDLFFESGSSYEVKVSSDEYGIVVSGIYADAVFIQDGVTLKLKTIDNTVDVADVNKMVQNAVVVVRSSLVGNFAKVELDEYLISQGVMADLEATSDGINIIWSYERGVLSGNVDVRSRADKKEDEDECPQYDNPETASCARETHLDTDHEIDGRKDLLPAKERAKRSAKADGMRAAPVAIDLRPKKLDQILAEAMSKGNRFEALAKSYGIQPSIGVMVDQLGHDSVLYKKVYDLSMDDIPIALSFLSGEVYASSQSVLLEDIMVVSSQISSRLHKTFIENKFRGVVSMAYEDSQNYSFWKTNFLSWGTFNVAALEGVEKVSFTNGDKLHVGFLAGADVLIVGSLRMGAILGYSSSGYVQASDTGEVSAFYNNLYCGFYGGQAINNVELHGNMVVAKHIGHVVRAITLLGVQEGLSGKYIAYSRQILLEAAYDQLTMGLDIVVKPFVQWASTAIKGAAFSEVDGLGALSVSNSFFEGVFVTLGLRGLACLSSDGAINLYYTVGFQGRLGGAPPVVKTAFVELMSFPTVYDGMEAVDGNYQPIVGIEVASRQFVLEFGLDVSVRDDLSVYVGYSGKFARFSNENVIKVDLNWNVSS